MNRPRNLLSSLLLFAGCADASEADPATNSAVFPERIGSADAVRLPPTEDGIARGTEASDCVACGSQASGGEPCRTTPVAPDEAARWDLCDALAARTATPLSSEGVSWARHLCDTVDLDRFTRPPAIPFVAKQASSTSRAAQREGEPGWFANDDRGHFLRRDGSEQVLMEAEGPGVITRIWSANPSGVLRVYIDDRDAPAIELPLVDFFAGMLGAPLSEPFVLRAGEGASAYFPIPYARYARVTVAGSTDLYYHVGYQSYPRGTEVEPFSIEGLDRIAPLAREIAKGLSAPETFLPPELAEEVLTVQPGTTQEAVIGPAVVRTLTVRGFEPSELALRTTRLILRVDGETTVDAPLGDLFGTGPGLFAHTSLAASMRDDALTLRFPMPVRGRIAVQLERQGAQSPPLTFSLRYTPGLPAEPRLFRARWSGAHTFDTRTASDWTILQTRGEGWYVGTRLNITNPAALWWGEGDEKVFVDGEATPSFFGTGTEDYFGYAWCSNERFTTPWFGQPRATPTMNWGRSALYRWHVGDAIPFTKSLHFKLEVLHWINTVSSVKLEEDAIAYWYAPACQPSEQAPLSLSAFQIPPQRGLVFPGSGGPFACR